MNVFAVESDMGITHTHSPLFIMLPKPTESKENPVFDFHPSTI